jgi:hypothetical protein
VEEHRARVARWAGVLDDLERQTERLETQLDGAGGDGGDLPVLTWSGPAEEGSMPPELAARARALQERQHALIDRLEQAQASNARHLQAVRELDERGPAGPVYIDTTG